MENNQQIPTQPTLKEVIADLKESGVAWSGLKEIVLGEKGKERITKMKRKTLIGIARTLALFMATFGVVLYKEYPYPYCLIMWIPIIIGYHLYIKAKDLF
ncbi:MAG: hypothetical protein IMZ60_02015 [Actinobacteria bacterium]|nr:hypothetical protein [Actinomycetota bacterium]